MRRPILLTLGLSLLAPLASASPPGPSPAQLASLRSQEAVAQRVAHDGVRQQAEALRRHLELRRQREAREAERPAPAPGSRPQTQ
jgi:hypothetical protein